MNNALLMLLPVAIAGLIGAVVGFYYANKERNEDQEQERPSGKRTSHAHSAAR